MSARTPEGSEATSWTPAVMTATRCGLRRPNTTLINYHDSYYTVKNVYIIYIFFININAINGFNLNMLTA